MKFCVSYLDSIHQPDKIRTTVDNVAAIIKRDFPKAQAIAFRGMSGAAIGYPLAYKLEMPIFNVRKNTDQSHSPYNVEGAPGFEISKYVIVDDLIDSGATVDSIVSALDGAKCVGIVLYAMGDSSYDRHMNIPIKCL